MTLCTRGGNRSWSGLVKKLDLDQFDYLFVLVADGRQWFIPADRVEGGRAILLGGPKYSEFEVEPGDPIPARHALRARLYNRLLIARGDVRVAKGAGL